MRRFETGYRVRFNPAFLAAIGELKFASGHVGTIERLTVSALARVRAVVLWDQTGLSSSVRVEDLMEVSI